MRRWRTSKTVTLKSNPLAGEITIAVDIDLDAISRDDKKFVGGALALIAAYEPGPEDADLFEAEIAALRKARP